MVWLYASPGLVPAGSLIGTVTLDGVPYDLWVESANGKALVTYRLQTPTTHFTLDLATLIHDAVTAGYLQSSSWLSAVLAGFQIYSGGAGLQVSDFYVSVN